MDEGASIGKGKIIEALESIIVSGGRQHCPRVRWHDAPTVACELGCKLFLGVPPGYTLIDLARENLPGIQAQPVSAETFNKLLPLAMS